MSCKQGSLERHELASVRDLLCSDPLGDLTILHMLKSVSRCPRTAAGAYWATASGHHDLVSRPLTATGCGQGSLHGEQTLIPGVSSLSDINMALSALRKKKKKTILFCAQDGYQ